MLTDKKPPPNKGGMKKDDDLTWQGDMSHRAAIKNGRLYNSKNRGVCKIIYIKKFLSGLNRSSNSTIQFSLGIRAQKSQMDLFSA